MSCLRVNKHKTYIRIVARDSTVYFEARFEQNMHDTLMWKLLLIRKLFPYSLESIIIIEYNLT